MAERNLSEIFAKYGLDEKTYDAGKLAFLAVIANNDNLTEEQIVQIAQEKTIRDMNDLKGKFLANESIDIDNVVPEFNIDTNDSIEKIDEEIEETTKIYEECEKKIIDDYEKESEEFFEHAKATGKDMEDILDKDEIFRKILDNTNKMLKAQIEMNNIQDKRIKDLEDQIAKLSEENKNSDHIAKKVTDIKETIKDSVKNKLKPLFDAKRKLLDFAYAQADNFREANIKIRQFLSRENMANKIDAVENIIEKACKDFKDSFLIMVAPIARAIEELNNKRLQKLNTELEQYKKELDESENKEKELEEKKNVLEKGIDGIKDVLSKSASRKLDGQISKYEKYINKQKEESKAIKKDISIILNRIEKIEKKESKKQKDASSIENMAKIAEGKLPEKEELLYMGFTPNQMKAIYDIQDYGINIISKYGIEKLKEMDDAEILVRGNIEAEKIDSLNFDPQKIQELSDIIREIIICKENDIQNYDFAEAMENYNNLFTKSIEHEKQINLTKDKELDEASIERV